MRTPSGGARPLALVTGATAGIGRVFADRLARRGYDLLLVSRDGQRLAAVARELSGLGISVEVLEADLSRDDDVARVAERIKTGNPLSLLVNNAGFGTKGLLIETPVEPQVAMLHLHVLAPMRLIQAALPGMLARRSGGVINVSSIAGFLFSPGSINYCASKAYLTVFSEGLATELAGTGIRVQALCPGFTRTEFHQRMAMESAALKRRRLWLTAEYVVDTSLAALDRGGPVVFIPGFRYKLIAALLRLMPRRLLRYLMQKRQHPRSGRPVENAMF